jgi:DNA polymerase-3 subunit gamma/tau
VNIDKPDFALDFELWPCYFTAMSYIVFARKYRPQTFDDVIGQSHITTTLKNAIAQSRVAHAYIFAGPRGVGKTTTARIFAKALNCDKGPTAKPCNKCLSCAEITGGSSLDILEIDGASNRGIEEIRSLRENVKFAPSKGRFKIYIIDEVHMLTPEAFNALLKTLEEPPPHVKFIFATTSPHKVPATILSRCQRFDFRRLATRDILGNLKTIVKDEKLNVKDDALDMIAKYGDGSMRNAQVILDQITSFSQGKVGVEDVTKILGVVDDEILFGISGAMKDRDAALALSIIDRLVNEGKDVVQVVLGLIEHFRNISVAKISPEADALIDAGPDKVALYRAEAERFTIEEMLYAIYTLSNTIDFIRKSTLARIPFEAALVKLTHVPSVIPLPDIVSRMESMQKNIAPSAHPSSGPANSLKAANKPEAPREPEDPGAPYLPAEESAASDKTAHSPAPKAGVAAPDLEEMTACWAKVVNYIRPKKISIASYLQEGYPASIDGGVLTLGFPRECQFHKDVLESLENKRIIEDAVREVTGLDLKVSLAIVEPAGSDSGMGTQDADGELPVAGGAEDSDPIVKAALSIFSGKISAGGNGKAG